MVFELNRLLSRILLAFLGLAAAAGGTAVAASEVIVWDAGSDTTQWNSALGVTATRYGCSGTPASCVAFAKARASQLRMRVYLAVPLTASSPSESLSYSSLTVAEPEVVSIGYDDFVSQYSHLISDQGSSAPSILGQAVSNLKAANSSLQLGLTMYTDEIGSYALSMTPETVRTKVDVIHLYSHFRSEASTYGSYVREVRSLFPNARIIAGLYAYDRRKYVPCSQSSAQQCTAAQELESLTQQLTLVRNMLTDGTLWGIEFYPGYFGNESGWSGWDVERICGSQTRDECISNTVAMRTAAYRALVQTSFPINGVVNAASYVSGPVAPGEVLTIFGTGLGPVEGVTFTPDSDNRMPVSLDGVTVYFDGTAAPIVYAQANQTNVVVPSDVKNRLKTVLRVAYYDHSSAPVELDVASASPGIFAADGSGARGAAALNIDYSLNSAANPAPTGSVVAVYATGAGVPDGLSTGRLAPLSAAELAMPSGAVSAQIGGIPAEITYFGGAPGLIVGVNQINVRIPAGAPRGDSVSVRLSVAGVLSQAGTTIAIQ